MRDVKVEQPRDSHHKVTHIGHTRNRHRKGGALEASNIRILIYRFSSAESVLSPCRELELTARRAVRTCRFRVGWQALSIALGRQSAIVEAGRRRRCFLDRRPLRAGLEGVGVTTRGRRGSPRRELAAHRRHAVMHD
jgi:hypothetical protein